MLNPYGGERPEKKILAAAVTKKLIKDALIVPFEETESGYMFRE